MGGHAPVIGSSVFVPSERGYRGRMNIQTLVQRIERAEHLDPVVERLASSVREATHGVGAQSMLAGTPLGHPAHPMMVSVPIGLWSAAATLDMAGGHRSRPAAQRLIGLGVLAAVPTAVTGLADWADTLGAERRVGFVHALANDAALLMYAASWNARRRGHHLSGVSRAVVAGVALSVGGWLGGHLAHSLGVGADTTAFDCGPEEWTAAAPEAEVTEGALVSAAAGEIPVVLTRRGGELFALHGRCSHRGAPLGDGKTVDGCIECPWHASRFDMRTGRVIRGPATCAQQSLDVRVRDGEVQVRRRAEFRALRQLSAGAQN